MVKEALASVGLDKSPVWSRASYRGQGGKEVKMLTFRQFALERAANSF